METLPSKIVQSNPQKSIMKVKKSFLEEERHFDNNAEIEAIANVVKSIYGQDSNLKLGSKTAAQSASAQ